MVTIYHSETTLRVVLGKHLAAVQKTDVRARRYASLSMALAAETDAKVRSLLELLGQARHISARVRRPAGRLHSTHDGPVEIEHESHMPEPSRLSQRQRDSTE
jgi:hypothetical protein